MSILSSLLAASVIATPKPATENVIFVMTDGLRRQEVFTGAEKPLMEAIKSEPFMKAYWRETAAERRSLLMPFVWSTIAQKGQIYGNRELGSESSVLNGHKFSYPGYNETLVGWPDPRVNSNAPKPNENVTVLEWLHKQPGLNGKVAAFASWENLANIINKNRCGFPVNAGFEPFEGLKGNKIVESMNIVKREVPRNWGDEAYDTLTFTTAFEYLKAKKPRLMYLELIETDAWGHANKYDQYLNAARRVDLYLSRLWEYVQSTPQYKDKTTLIVTCDHGRGDDKLWTSHGATIKDAEFTWMFFIGPDTKPLGERKNVPAVTNGMIAATIAKLLGFDYNAAEPKAASPIADVLN